LRANERAVQALALLTVLGDYRAGHVARVVQKAVALMLVNTLSIVVLNHARRAEAALNAAGLCARRVVASGQVHACLWTHRTARFVLFAELALNRTLVLTSPLDGHAQVDARLSEIGQRAAQALAVTTAVAAACVEQAVDVRSFALTLLHLGQARAEGILGIRVEHETALFGGPLLAV
jgi:hypothetical protein